MTVGRTRWIPLTGPLVDRRALSVECLLALALQRASRRAGPIPMKRPELGDGQDAGNEIGLDNRQLEAVYRIEAPRLMRLLKRRIWMEEDRSDIVQEAFVRLAASHSGAARSNPGAYLHGIVRHLLADRVRRWARSRSFDAMSVPAAEPLGPHGAAEIGQMRDQYHAAVEALPPKTREVYLLHRADDLDYKTIASRLGISVRTVEWHVAQAIVRIGKSIGAHG